MGLTLRPKETLLKLDTEIPHYFVVKFQNHPNGLKQVCCGTWKDVERTLAIHPDALVTQVFPPAPTTVNVSAQDLGSEEALNEGKKALPQSEQLPLDL